MKMSSEMTLAHPVSWPDFLTEARKLVDAELDRLLPAESLPPKTIHAAIRWSVFAGGKRFRPALLLATGETFGATRHALLRTGCALEKIHHHSLALYDFFFT